LPRGIQGTRDFENAYHRYFGRVRRHLGKASGFLLLTLSVLRGTLAYALEVAVLFASLRLSGLKLWKPKDYLKASLAIAAIAAALETILSKPPLSLLVVSSNLASSLSLILGQSSVRWALPSLAGAGVYALRGDAPLSIVTIAFLGAMPLVVRGIDAVTGANSVGFLRGFVLESLNGPEEFERLLGSLPTESKPLKTHLFLVKQRGAGRKLALVISSAHSGPFGRVGSSPLVEMLKERLEGSGFELLYLHGTGGHENDLISRKETGLLVERIWERLKSMDEGNGLEASVSHPSGLHGFSKIETENLELRVLGLCGKKLVIVSSKRKSSDDIPSSLSVLEDLHGAILVDAQNSYSLDNGFEHQEEEELLAALRELDSVALHCRNGRVGFSAIPREELDETGQEVGPLGLRSLVVECDGRRMALLAFDGNNMAPGLREDLRASVRDLVDDAEVVTTDNHSMTGFMGVRGYRVVGETVSRGKLLSKAREAVVEALKSLDRADFSYTCLVFRARVLGDSGLTVLRRAVSRVPAALLVYVSVLVVLPVLLSLLYS